MPVFPLLAGRAPNILTKSTISAQHSFLSVLHSAHGSSFFYSHGFLSTSRSGNSFRGKTIKSKLMQMTKRPAFSFTFTSFFPPPFSMMNL
jgi:hypothetical protein